MTPTHAPAGPAPRPTPDPALRRRRSRTTRLVAAVGAAAALALVAAGCSSSDDTSSGATGSATGGHQTLTVFAAASLTKTFTELGKTFEQQHPGVTVRLSFAGSSDLVAQIIAGAPADVFASADEANMTKATDSHLTADTPRAFASNTLTIVTPPGNPAHVTSLQDLANPKVKTVVCAAQVPCGAAAQQVERVAGVTIHPVSEEEKVTDVLAKVTSGEADAGLVYVTDALGALATKPGSVVRVDFPEAKSVVNTYPIAAIRGDHIALAQQFETLVLSDAGQQVLADAGFAPPPTGTMQATTDATSTAAAG